MGVGYALSNFAISSATTAPAVGSECAAPVDPLIAPTYARLHEQHDVTAEAIVIAGLIALRSHHF